MNKLSPKNRPPSRPVVFAKKRAAQATSSSAFKRNRDRKDSHLSISLNENIEYYSLNSNGFSHYRFDHDALPEINFESIQLETTLLGKKLAAPLIIGAMTGGTDRAREMNRRVALAAEHCQVGFALGSQRKLVEAPDNLKILKSYTVRKFAPRLPLLFGNLGAVQLNYGVTADQVKRLIEMTECDALNLHLNPLQEAIQPEGDRNFAGLLKRLQEFIPQIPVPVFLKEVGAGISLTTARKIKKLPFQGIETAGVGGTSWSKIESLRSAELQNQTTGELFARWGIPTAESLLICRAEFPKLTVVAGGGIRNGIEVAKALALGADAVTVALPILKAADHSIEHAIAAIEQILAELRTSLFVTGMANIADLKTRGKSLLRRDLSAPHFSGDLHAGA